MIPAEIARQRTFPRLRCWIDLVVAGQIGEAFEDAEQFLVPGSAQDLHIARPARRAEWPALSGFTVSPALQSGDNLTQFGTR